MQSPDRSAAPSLPSYFELLSAEDRAAYLELRRELSSSSTKFKRYQRVKSVSDALSLIRSFCMRGDAGDATRCAVCGACWMGWDIAINTRQLRLLLNKCKSSINGALAKMGYSTVPVKGDASAALAASIPLLAGNFAEQRMWTVRRRLVRSPSPLVAPAPQIVPLPVFATPQLAPVLPPRTAQGSDIAAVFGDSIDLIDIPDISVPDSQFLVEDPCCCCMLDWASEHSGADDTALFLG